MKKTFLIAFLSSACLGALLTTSCDDPYTHEKIMLDSLQLFLDESADHLELDVEMIKARMTDMELNYTKFIRNYKDTMDLELGIQLDRHKGIRKQYKKAIKDHQIYSEELLALRKQVHDLRKGLTQGDISKEEFKAYYRQEASDVKALQLNSKALQHNLYELEPAYYRLSDFLTAQLDALKEE